MAAMDAFDPYFDYDEEDNAPLPPRLNADDSHIASRRVEDTSSLPAPALPASAIHIDDEVVVKNKRKPIVKIGNQLVLDRGLKHLKNDAPRNLKFKGKGHEKQDLQRLLNYYQLWMHDVFPKARFRDCIAMTEKAGHEQRIRIMRKQWIDDTKPRATPNEEDLLDKDGAEILDNLEREAAALGREQDAQRAQANGEATNTETETAAAEDEPLFVDDMSDFDMDEVLQSSQKQPEETVDNAAVGEKRATEPVQKDDFDDFADEMDAIHDLDDF